MNISEETQLKLVILRRTIRDLKYTIWRMTDVLPDGHITFFTDKLEWITKVAVDTNWAESYWEPTHFTQLVYKLSSMLVYIGLLVY